MIADFSDYLSQQQSIHLRDLSPPPVPPDPPKDASAVILWYKEEYLPYRKWATLGGGQNTKHIASDLAKKFSLWFLDYYPSAIATGDTLVNHSVSGSALKKNEDKVVLFVIADGLGHDDAVILNQELSNSSSLVHIRSEMLFTAIPTITEYCKPAMKFGCIPKDTPINDSKLPEYVVRLAESKSPLETLGNAIEGQVFLWSFSEPDKTYHDTSDIETLLIKTRSQLTAIADRIHDALEAIPSHLKVSLFIGTDHGRLLGKSKRSRSFSKDFKSHQRVAIGPRIAPLEIPGYVLNESGVIATLDGKRFGFSDDEDCIIMLSDDCFLKNDGKKGLEHFPHGGLSPEEVIVPWNEFERAYEMPPISCRIHGTGAHGQSAEATFSFQNPSKISVTISELQITLPDELPMSHNINKLVPAMGKMDFSAFIEKWPSSSLIAGSKATFKVKLPGGREKEFAAEIDLLSEGFYHSDDKAGILGDLE